MACYFPLSTAIYQSYFEWEVASTAFEIPLTSTPNLSSFPTSAPLYLLVTLLKIKEPRTYAGVNTTS